MWSKGLGFRVQVSGFGVQGSGFRVQGSEFRVQGSRFRVWAICQTRSRTPRPISSHLIAEQDIMRPG